MILKPDLELLDKPIILDPKDYRLEVDDNYYHSISEFFRRQNAESVIDELLFYQLNLCEGPKRIDSFANRIMAENTARKKLIELFSKSKLHRITFEFSDKPNESPEKVSIDQELFDYIKQIVKSELSSYDNTLHGRELDRVKNYKKLASTFRLIIQEEKDKILKILKARNPKANDNNAILCTYGIYYQYGYRLNFKPSLAEMEIEMTDEDFKKKIEETTNPVEVSSFDEKRILKNALSHPKK